MQSQHILDSVEPEIASRIVSRRDAIRQGAAASTVLAAGLRLGSVPVALAALARDAFAQTPDTVTQVLQFAYLLENLEYHFYNSALTAASFATVRAQLSATETAVLTKIRDHEQAHVQFLGAALGGAAPAYTAASFDFTGGNGSGTGPLVTATTDKAVLLAAAQAFEDLGVRAYKGSAADLMSNKAVLTAALQIHSVEARHAAKLRRLRGLPGWITQAQSGITAPAGAQPIVDAIYAGENATTQGGVNLTTVAGITGGADAITEAFDEPLSRDAVRSIVAPFVVGDNP